jgi:hypothetical protein
MTEGEHIQVGRRTFEVFKGRSGSYNREQMRVTLSMYGAFHFNKATALALGNPSTVQFFYDKQTRTIGVKPGSNGKAYRFQKQSLGLSYIVTAKAFAVHCGLLPRKDLLVFQPIIEDGFLVLEITTAVSVTPRHRERRYVS